MSSRNSSPATQRSVITTRSKGGDTRGTSGVAAAVAAAAGRKESPPSAPLRRISLGADTRSAAKKDVSGGSAAQGDNKSAVSKRQPASVVSTTSISSSASSSSSSSSVQRRSSLGGETRSALKRDSSSSSSASSSSSSSSLHLEPPASKKAIVVDDTDPPAEKTSPGTTNLKVLPRRRSGLTSAGAHRSLNMEKDQDGNFIYRRRTASLETSTKVADATSKYKEALVTSRKRGYEDVDAPSTSIAPRKKIRTLRTTSSGEEVEKDGFCWLCHREGQGICCVMCPRMYHTRCLGIEEPTTAEWVCPECERMMRAECIETRSLAMASISLDRFCLLLRYSLQRMKHSESEAFMKPVDISEVQHYSDFVINPVDLSTLEKNIKKKAYGSTEAFLADAMWILHNCTVFNGVQHKLSSNVKAILKICKHEMAEIEICPDCYYSSCTKRNNKWFCEPCTNPHPLVWAKMKGYPFWPAKALRCTNGLVDVRFFGEHDRAWVSVGQVFLLSTDAPTSVKAKKRGFDESMEELDIHIHRLKEKFGGFEYAPNKTLYDPTNPHRHNRIVVVRGDPEIKQEHPSGAMSDAKSAKSPIKAQDSSPSRTRDSPSRAKESPLRYGASLGSRTKTPEKPTSAATKTASAVRLKYSSIISTRRGAMTTARVKALSSADGKSSPSAKTETPGGDDVSSSSSDELLLHLDESREIIELDKENDACEPVKKRLKMADVSEPHAVSAGAAGDTDVSVVESSSGAAIRTAESDNDTAETVDHEKTASKTDAAFLISETAKIIVSDSSKLMFHDAEGKTALDVPKLKLPDKSIISKIADTLKVRQEMDAVANGDEAEKSGQAMEELSGSSKDADHPKMLTDESSSSTGSSVPTGDKAALPMDKDEDGLSIVEVTEKGAKLSSPLSDGGKEDGVEGDIEFVRPLISDQAKKGNTFLEKIVASCKEKLGIDGEESAMKEDDDEKEEEEEEEDVDEVVMGPPSTGEESMDSDSSSTSDSTTSSTSPDSEEVEAETADDGEEKKKQETNHTSEEDEVREKVEVEETSVDKIPDKDAELLKEGKEDEESQSTVEKMDSESPAGKANGALGNDEQESSGIAKDFTSESRFRDADSIVIDDETPCSETGSPAGKQDSEAVEADAVVETSVKDSASATEDQKQNDLHSRTVECTEMASGQNEGQGQHDQGQGQTESQDDSHVTLKDILLKVACGLPENAMEIDKECPLQTQPENSRSESPATAASPASTHDSITATTSAASATSIPAGSASSSPAQEATSAMETSPVHSQATPAKSPVVVPPSSTADPTVREVYQNLSCVNPDLTFYGFDFSKYTDKIMNSLKGTFSDLCEDLLQHEGGSELRRHLQLEIDRLKWQHDQEVAEIKHNADLRLAEMRATMETDKLRSVEQATLRVGDLKKALEKLESEKKCVESRLEMEKKLAIEETKKKQWCASCGKEAIFYCCWNTSYCDYPCQQSHWPEHMGQCAQSQPPSSNQSTPQRPADLQVAGPAKASPSPIRTTPQAPANQQMGGNVAETFKDMARQGLAQVLQQERLRAPNIIGAFPISSAPPRTQYLQQAPQTVQRQSTRVPTPTGSPFQNHQYSQQMMQTTQPMTMQQFSVQPGVSPLPQYQQQYGRLPQPMMQQQRVIQPTATSMMMQSASMRNAQAALPPLLGQPIMVAPQGAPRMSAGNVMQGRFAPAPSYTLQYGNQ